MSVADPAMPRSHRNRLAQVLRRRLTNTERRDRCPVAAIPLMPKAAVSAEGEPRPNQFWWPDQLDLSPLRQHAAESNPLGENFDYAKAFLRLDLNAVKQDIAKVLTTSQDW